MQLLTHYHDRTGCYDLAIKTAAGVPIPLASGDRVRLKIGDSDGTPLLDLRSGLPSPNNSTLTFTAGGSTVTLNITADETLDWAPRAYVGEVIVEFASRDYAPYSTHLFVFSLIRTPGGELTYETGDPQSSSSSDTSESS